MATEQAQIRTIFHRPMFWVVNFCWMFLFAIFAGPPFTFIPYRILNEDAWSGGGCYSFRGDPKTLEKRVLAELQSKGYTAYQGTGVYDLMWGKGGHWVYIYQGRCKNESIEPAKGWMSVVTVN